MAGRPGIDSLRILVVDDDANIRLTLSMCLEAEGHVVFTAAGVEEALAEVGRRVLDLVFLDVRLGTQDGLDFLPQLLAQSPRAKVVVITAFASVATAVKAFKGGAADFLPKPFTPAQVQAVAERVAERRRLEWKVEALQAALGDDPDADLPTADPAMRAALDLARQVADSNATVLIQGEVGTRKGRLARAVHAWSARADGPFAGVACDARPADALEAELFGAAESEPCEGRGAPRERPGRVSFCDGGTLVLERVGETPPSLQPNLLRLLGEREYERQNDFKARRADVRFVATTGSDLESAERSGRLRPELRLALEVVKVELPPLRQRPQDVPLLARRYLAFYGREHRRPAAAFTADALHALGRHAWPGNARELRNVVERAVLLCPAERVGLEHLPPNLLNGSSAYTVGDLVSLETIEQMHVRGVVAAAGSLRGAASILGVHTNTLGRWLRRHGAAAGGGGDPDATPATRPDD